MRCIAGEVLHSTGFSMPIYHFADSAFLQRLVAAISEDRFYWYLWGMGVLFGLGLPAFQQISGFDPIGINVPF